MALSNTLLTAQVMHARARPKVNRFRYSVYYLAVRLSELPLLDTLTVVSLNRFNLFSLRECDYGKAQPLTWIREVLQQWNVPEADGEVVLMTMPRILGYAFNPVSFWFCLDQAGALRAVLADVSNTFGERHAYLLFHDDKRVILQDNIFSSEKIFHVSPFIKVEGRYEFRFAYSEERIGVWIDHHDEHGLLLSTSVAGRRQPATSRALMFCFIRYPMLTLKVIGLIHYQALRLFIKGVRYHVKPLPPLTEISR